jgi:FlaA1/EpsC-like NDP-sugar epimerase
MQRYWITLAHAAAAAAQAPLLAADGARLAALGDAVTLTVGELAGRIWRAAGNEGGPTLDVVGIRPGETLGEVLTAPGEVLGASRLQGIAPIRGDISAAGAAWVLERLPERGSSEESTAVWLEALRRPGLLEPSAAPAS